MMDVMFICSAHWVMCVWVMCVFSSCLLYVCSFSIYSIPLLYIFTLYPTSVLMQLSYTVICIL